MSCTDPLACNFLVPIPGVDTCVYPVTYYIDADSDTYGLAGSDSLACSVPVGYVTDNTDCDDTNADVYPTALEICDGLDNNCDGFIDEGAAVNLYTHVNLKNENTRTLVSSYTSSFTAVVEGPVAKIEVVKVGPDGTAWVDGLV